ncbi:Brix-domain-containing protein [Neoconidiobolus thromboides FSU 785]|nr:Brix-domain-containing protein [Neoconidiobolus thromboides FSU 785]
MGKRKGKKTRTHVAPDAEEVKKIPKSFVIKSGNVGNTVAALVKDVRKVMEPNTATNLREQKRNKLKDYLQVAGQYGVSHMMIFTRTDMGTYLKVGRIPRGPTLNFRVMNYSLTKDIVKFLKKPKTLPSDYLTPPLLVLNNFGEKLPNVKLVTAMFQNMFPALNVQKMQLNEAKRVLLLNYNQDTGYIDFRHYSISVKVTGISKGIKKIIQAEIPSLGKFEDISEYVVRESIAAESDLEDGPENQITLDQGHTGRNSQKSQKRVIKLTELGPRMELDLVKIQAGLLTGQVLYHKYIKKTTSEVEKQEKEFKTKQEGLEARKKEQELNIKKKKEAAEAHRIACGAPLNKDEVKDESNDEDDVLDQDDIVDDGDLNEDDLFDEDNESIKSENESVKSEDDEVYIKTEDEDENLSNGNDPVQDDDSDVEIKEEEPEPVLKKKRSK